jgi:hypothetical protein
MLAKEFTHVLTKSVVPTLRLAKQSIGAKSVKRKLSTITSGKEFMELLVSLST